MIGTSLNRRPLRSRRPRQALPRYHVEPLENRTLLAVFIVKDTTDLGTDSLRTAMNRANANPGPDLISFDIPGAGVHTIKPNSPPADHQGPRCHRRHVAAGVRRATGD